MAEEGGVHLTQAEGENLHDLHGEIGGLGDEEEKLFHVDGDEFTIGGGDGSGAAGLFVHQGHLAENFVLRERGDGFFAEADGDRAVADDKHFRADVALAENDFARLVSPEVRGVAKEADFDGASVGHTAIF